MYFPWLFTFPLTIIRYRNKLSTELCLKIEHLLGVVILTPIVYITRYIYEEISWDQRLFKFMFLFSWVFIWEKENHTPNVAHKYKQKNGKKREKRKTREETQWDKMNNICYLGFHWHLLSRQIVNIQILPYIFLQLARNHIFISLESKLVLSHQLKTTTQNRSFR